MFETLCNLANSVIVVLNLVTVDVPGVIIIPVETLYALVVLSESKPLFI